ncbi:MAG: phosphatase PAP2 family protein [Acidimicrobiia bacterium]|nr:phosphatase PAP2 family protein [Acidimicrobiia bacterium]
MTDESDARPLESAAEVLATRLQDSAQNVSERTLEALREVGRLDRAIYAAVADTPTPTIDEPIRRLSNAANFSKLWFGIAGVLAVTGGQKGRCAALTGIIAIGASSAIVNQGMKRLYPRARPDRAGEEVPVERYVRMPDSTSFPSGHSASGFAFANAVGVSYPVLALPLRFLAGAVAYSRVHTGVHYPGDAVVGSLVGAGVGSITAGIVTPRCREHL